MRQVVFAVVCVAFAGLMAACNDVGTCPAASAVVPGGSCSGDMLACPYTLGSLSPVCDGTNVDGGIATSCVCTNGSWVCPSPAACPGVPADGGDDGADAAIDSSGEGDSPGEADSPGGG